MSERKPDEFVAVIRGPYPKMMVRYPSTLSLIMEHAERRSVLPNDLGIRVALVTGERLHGEQRATIARVFGCPVTNRYGGRDSGLFAHECPQGEFHLSSECVLVEVLDSGRDPVAFREPREIAVTHTVTRDFPFVSFRTGDSGVLDGRECNCGRSVPILMEVKGSSIEFVIAADGTVIRGLALVYVQGALPGIKRFKISEESRALTRVSLASQAGGTEEIHQCIRTDLPARLGSEVQAEIERVASIAQERSGNFRYFVSHAAMRSGTV